jgi:hypothetical protein
MVLVKESANNRRGDGRSNAPATTKKPEILERCLSQIRNDLAPIRRHLVASLVYVLAEGRNSAVNGQLDGPTTSTTINHQPSTINHQPSTINHQPSTINHQPSTIN